jgi:hypothetical protein
MRLGDKQRLFALLVGKLILEAYYQGYQLTFGETWRSPEEAERRGFANSNHTRRLAIDLNLFKDGEYLTRTEDHQELGEWWEQQHELCRWGGRFNDGNHYSLEHEGVQ